MLVHNTIRTLAFNKISEMEIPKVSDSILDEIQAQAMEFLHSQGINIGKTRTREILVDYIINEFGVGVFGVSEPRPRREITDKAVKKYQKMRKRGV